MAVKKHQGKDKAVVAEGVPTCAAEREELEQEIARLEAEAVRVAQEARELAGEVPF